MVNDDLRAHLISTQDRINAEVAASGRCWSHNPDVHHPARYLWHCTNGNVVPLCIECCAAWRANAEEEPTLAPARITEIDQC